MSPNYPTWEAWRRTCGADFDTLSGNDFKISQTFARNIVCAAGPAIVPDSTIAPTKFVTRPLHRRQGLSRSPSGDPGPSLPVIWGQKRGTTYSHCVARQDRARQLTFTSCSPTPTNAQVKPPHSPPLSSSSSSSSSSNNSSSSSTASSDLQEHSLPNSLAFSRLSSLVFSPSPHLISPTTNSDLSISPPTLGDPRSNPALLDLSPGWRERASLSVDTELDTGPETFVLLIRSPIFAPHPPTVKDDWPTPTSSPSSVHLRSR
ncbi:hypothetical protein QBC36DRAFT_309168 [Triangularia setosa]|uniref:Uncharacterized protein n=1 Tax=Triangularia setosa TaxID=2587417 RepID=A0AAN6WAV1_9PEZI|nr:hypothetical protein QBC36DRAFT_309168 [Podospora setosa]